MIYASLFVAGVGIGYGAHSGNPVIIGIATWLLVVTLILAVLAGVARMNDTSDRVVAQQFEEDAQRGFGERAHYKMPDDLYALPTAVRGSYPADEDVEAEHGLD